jgi:type IV pilus assembly protein PilA
MAAAYINHRTPRSLKTQEYVMRQGFTLIELMIVIAIIAIIAAIAIPNLLESRVTSQESASAAALKSGLLPGEVQFQSGGYSDRDNNGIGTYAVVGASGISGATNQLVFDTLSGSATIGGVTLNLMAPAYAGATPIISGYIFKQPIADVAPNAALDLGAERVWGTICYPADNNQGRRYFTINQAGNVYSSKPGGTASASGLAASVLNVALFGVSLSSSPSSLTYLPYRK